MSFAVIAGSVGRGAQVATPSSGHTAPGMVGAGVGIVATAVPLHAATNKTRGKALRRTGVLRVNVVVTSGATDLALANPVLLCALDDSKSRPINLCRPS